jgi:hypothetical protein
MVVTACHVIVIIDIPCIEEIAIVITRVSIRLIARRLAPSPSVAAVAIIAPVTLMALIAVMTLTALMPS